MDAMRLESYSKALCEFADDQDTLFVLEKLVKNPREEFEAKIPEMGNLLGMVRARRYSRKAAERQEQQDAEHALYLKDIKDNPSNYVSIAELMAEYKSKRTEAK